MRRAVLLALTLLVPASSFAVEPLPVREMPLKLQAAFLNPILFDVVCAGGVIGACPGGGAAVGGSSTLGFNDNVSLTFGTGTDTAITYNTTQTPDSWFFGVGQDSRGIIIAEQADAAFDFAHAQATNPTLFIHSAAQSTTQWLSLAHNGTDGVLAAGSGSLILSPSTATILASSTRKYSFVDEPTAWVARDGSLGGLEFATVSIQRIGITGPSLRLERTVTAAGTTGAQTINKMAGTVNFAAAASTLVVTNSVATTTSIVFAVLRTADSTCRLAHVVPAAGSFTITMTAACNAETSVGFWVTN